MNILSVSKSENKAVISLDASELVLIGNVFWEASKEKQNSSFHRLYSNFLIAMDICQYGGIDAFRLETIVREREKAKEDE